jgi:methyl-accepting chemotaxis protein
MSMQQVGVGHGGRLRRHSTLKTHMVNFPDRQPEHAHASCGNRKGRFTIAVRLIATVSLLVVMLSTLTGYVIWRSHASSRASRQVVDQELELARLAEQWSLLVQVNVARAKVRANLDLGSYATSFDTDFRATSALISKVQSAVEFRVAGTPLASDYRALVAIRKNVVGVTSRIADIRERNEATVMQGYLDSTYYPAVAAYLAALDRFASKSAEIASVRLGLIEEENRRQILRAVLMCMTVAGFAILAVRHLTARIVKPLTAALLHANAIARGELGGELEWQSNDEIGDLVAALKIMDRQLADTARQIKGASESVSSISEEIVRHSDILSRVTEEQAAAIAQTACSTTQLSEGVKQNSDNARVANKLATRASSMAKSGDETVQAMILTMRQINGSSVKIAEITGLIDDIAFRTNILALNAAVEAARAGEQGRGFAVVANEVRMLAQRSSAAAREIKGLIDSSVTTAQVGAEQITDVGLAMGDVKEAIEQLSNLVGEITAASVGQSQGIEQVSRAVTQMEEGKKRNASLVERAADSAQSLENQAMKLNGAIAAFKV